MKHIVRFAIWAFLIAVTWIGCARQPGPSDASKQKTVEQSDERKLPFNQHQQDDGISPSSSLIPAAAEVPAGTPLTVRLRSSISSVTAHVGDSFDAVLDEPVTVQGKLILNAGLPASGSVVALNRFATADAPAYLRLRLTSVNWQHKTLAVESSSINAKAGIAKAGGAPAVRANGESFSSASPISHVRRNVEFAAGRRLVFRLTAPLAITR